MTEPNPGALAYDAPLLLPGEGTSERGAHRSARLLPRLAMLLLGEGTGEIQRTIVVRGLTRRWKDERDGT